MMTFHDLLELVLTFQIFASSFRRLWKILTVRIAKWFADFSATIKNPSLLTASIVVLIIGRTFQIITYIGQVAVALTHDSSFELK